MAVNRFLLTAHEVNLSHSR